MPSSRESSQPRDRTQVSSTAGRFLTIWATREADHSMADINGSPHNFVPPPNSELKPIPFPPTRGVSRSLSLSSSLWAHHDCPRLSIWAQAWQSQPPRQDPCPKQHFQPLLRDLLRCLCVVNICLNCCLLNLHCVPECYSFNSRTILWGYPPVSGIDCVEPQLNSISQTPWQLSLAIGLSFCQSLARKVLCVASRPACTLPPHLWLSVFFSLPVSCEDKYSDAGIINWMESGFWITSQRMATAQ